MILPRPIPSVHLRDIKALKVAMSQGRSVTMSHDGLKAVMVTGYNHYYQKKINLY